MTVAHDPLHRNMASGSFSGAVCLQDKYEVLKDIGDGSFGSVALARVRAGGSHIVRRGTLVAIKTMKKTFESFAPCLELREIIFLRTLPNHPHLVPALDIFLDPLSKKLHIAMEYMDGNLYQLMKARDHKPFDGSTVKSILFQILSGLEHIHEHEFFHRDIKPENILVSLSGREEVGSAFRRYSQLVTPPSTPPSYSVKIADFGLARETHSKLPYTTYVSTRWYRAPEVLLRAGEYSAPVDIWAIGAMAVEIATLKPLFPGGNEVDQVWRVCEIMGSPGNWVNRHQQKVGGGEWKEGVKLAQKLSFSFPKMAPHTMDTILVPPQWPLSLSNFVTWCLMWDPKARPTSTQAMQHEYFTDAYDPLRPKSSRSGLLSRKHSDITGIQSSESAQSLTTKTSNWFRKSLIARESAPAIHQLSQVQAPLSPQASPIKPEPIEPNVNAYKPRPSQMKRATWTNGANVVGAPMPILPSIRPISPLSNTVTAEGYSTDQQGHQIHSNATSVGRNDSHQQPSKKIGRQLSVASNGNHYADIHRQEAERALNGGAPIASGLTSAGSQKESFFSHLRKRARRLSGRHQLPLTPSTKGDEAMEDAGRTPWSIKGGAHDNGQQQQSMSSADFADLDRALQNVRYSLDASQQQQLAGGAANHIAIPAPVQPAPVKTAQRALSNPTLKRHHSLPHAQAQNGRTSPGPGLFASRSTRRAAQKPSLPPSQYDAPDEQDELLDEALNGAHAAALRLDKQHNARSSIPAVHKAASHANLPYNASLGALGGGVALPREVKGSGPINIKSKEKHQSSSYPFPTPPYEENEWAQSALAGAAGPADPSWR